MPVATQVAPARNPRRNVNPSGRRRTVALFGLVLVIVAGMAGSAALLSRPSKAAPPPVKVPRLRGQSATSAGTILRSLGLRVRTLAVPAPGLAPGTVTRQTPAAGAELPPASRVRLYVAEVPRWRHVTSFAGTANGASVPFQIHGTRWRIVYSMGYQGTCTFILFCSGPTAHVSSLSVRSRDSQFDLSSGQDQVQGFSPGAGIYQVTVSPGDDTANWTMKVEDYY